MTAPAAIGEVPAASRAHLIRGLPPGPALHPILQTLHFLIAPEASTLSAMKRWGDLYTIETIVFGKEVAVVDPELVKQIFTGDPDVFHAGEANTALGPMVGLRSLLLLDGAEHLRERRLMMPAFHGERMQAYAETMAEVTERIISSFRAGDRFSLHHPMQRITLEIILRTVFGLADGPRRDRIRDCLAAFMNKAQSRLSLLMMIPALQRDLGGYSPWAAFKRLRAEVDALIYAEIADRRAELARPESERRSDVLSMFLGARDESGQGMGDVELRDELMTLLVAGHETTATALCWAFEQVLGNPAVHERLLAEIDGAAAEGKARPDELTRLEYLDATIKEVLRRRPVIPVVGRKLKRSIVLGGYEIPAETLIVPSIYGIHRRPDVYPDPEVFRPERFLGKKTDPYSWFPFGGGVRRCLGMAFAMYELKIVLATVLRRVHLRLVKPAPLAVVLRSFVFAPEGGTEVVITGQRR
ncbi:MAG: cytochrome P450 [Minicystis sp.]